MPFYSIVNPNLDDVLQIRDKESLKGEIADNWERYENNGICALIDFDNKTCEFFEVRQEIITHIDFIK